LNRLGGDVMVRIEGLGKSFDGNVALESLSLVVKSGELFGLIGPDGAGKTTLIRILAGVEPPGEGTVEVGGIDVSREPGQVRSLVGYMPQHFSLYPDLTVEENLKFHAAMFGLSRRERKERLARLYRFSRLEPFRNRRAIDLSGGMKRKLSLSATLIGSPVLLLLDEPTTGVDPVSRLELWGILDELVSEGITVIVSTPYMDEAARCHRVALIHNGRLLAVDRPENLSRLFSGTLVEIRGPGLIRLADRLRELPGVTWVQLLGDRVHAAARDTTPERILPAIRAACPEAESVETVNPGMEDIFLNLMGSGT